MISLAGRRVRASSLTRGRLHQQKWRGSIKSACRSHPCRAITSDFSVWPNPDAGVTMGRGEVMMNATATTADSGEQAEDPGGSNRADMAKILGHDITQIVKSNKGTLLPELVKMVVTATEVDGTTDAFEVMARAHAEVNTPHLTLEMCNAVQKSSGKPFVPSSPQALVFLLKAMKPEIALHASGDCRSMIGDVAVGELMRRFKAGGQEVPLEAYKAAIKALDAPDSCLAALEFAREACGKFGVTAEPGVGVLYDLVMRRCQMQQRPDVIQEVLQERREAGGNLAPKDRDYATALLCLGRAKKVAEALDLLGDMVERGEKPNKNAINNVLAACARDAPVYWRHAKSVFEGMEERWDVPPNLLHYTSLVTCLLKAGRWGEAIAMTDKMEVDGIAPNARFLDHMMQASVMARQWVTAEAIFRAMTEKYGHAAVVSRQSTSNFIKCMVMQKKMRKIISHVARVQDIHLTGPASKCSLDTHLLKCFRVIPGVGCEALAGALMTMVEKGVRLHPRSYSVVISKANQEGNSVLSNKVHKMFLDAHGPPSLSVANAAIKGCSDIDSAMDILESMRDAGISPDQHTYAALLRCCSNSLEDPKQGERTTQVWEAMLSEGIVPLGGMLIPYVLALMRAGEWERALEARESFGKKQCTEANPHAPKLVLESRQNAVVDGIIAKGLMDNGQSTQALKFVLDMLEGWPTKGSSTPDEARYLDEHNHTIVTGIRACAKTGSSATALGLLEACEARWAMGPLSREAKARASHDHDKEGDRKWLEMVVKARESRRRIYDSLVCLLDKNEADWSVIRHVLEKGMKNGAVSLLKDSVGGNTSEQVVEFHGWSVKSARCIMKCIIEDLAQGKDFLLDNHQYDLGRVVVAQGVREFGDMSERWHVDSPDPRGRQRVFADGARPARFGEREYGKGRKRADGTSRWQRPGGERGAEDADETQAFWWKQEKRLSLVVGKPRSRPSVRHSIEEFCMLGVSHPLRVRKDGKNPGLMTLEAEDVQSWLQQQPEVL